MLIAQNWRVIEVNASVSILDQAITFWLNVWLLRATSRWYLIADHNIPGQTTLYHKHQGGSQAARWKPRSLGFGRLGGTNQVVGRYMGSQEAGTVPLLRVCKSTCLDLRSCLGSDNIARPILIFANRQTVRGNVSVKRETGPRWGLEERFGAGTNLGRRQLWRREPSIPSDTHRTQHWDRCTACLGHSCSRIIFLQIPYIYYLALFSEGREKELQKNTLKHENM